MKKIRLWPYKIGSASARALQQALQAEGLDCLKVRTDGRYRYRLNHLLINWGNSSPAMPHVQMLNKDSAIAIASNKRTTLRKLSEQNISVPEFNIPTPVSAIRAWATGVLEDGKKIYCRTKLTGHSGDGIVVARTVEELVDAPLYTVGIDVKHEYRIHVFKNPAGEYQIIDVVKKRRRNDALDSESLNTDVRNLAGGWVYCHHNVSVADDVKQSAIQAVQAIGLDFGAVDVVLDRERHYVLEVNSAPGLSSPTTIAAYVTAIKEWCHV